MSAIILVLMMEPKVSKNEQKTCCMFGFETGTV